jgi:hypothetical protein
VAAKPKLALPKPAATKPKPAAAAHKPKATGGAGEDADAEEGAAKGPKRALNAYLYFTQANRSQVKGALEGWFCLWNSLVLSGAEQVVGPCCNYDPLDAPVPLSHHCSSPLCLPPAAADHAELDNKGVTAKLGELYKALTPEEKAPYEVGAARRVGGWTPQVAFGEDAGCLAVWLPGLAAKIMHPSPACAICPA